MNKVVRRVIARLARCAGSITLCGVSLGMCRGMSTTRVAVDARDSCLSPEWPNVGGSSVDPQFEGVVAMTVTGPRLHLDRSQCFVIGGKSQYKDSIDLDNVSTSEIAKLAGHRVLVSGHVRDRGDLIHIDVESSTVVL